MIDNTFTPASSETTGAKASGVEQLVLDTLQPGDNPALAQEIYDYEEAALIVARQREARDEQEVSNAKAELASEYRLLAKAMNDPKQSTGIIAAIKRHIGSARARVTSGFARLRQDTSKIERIQQDIGPTRGGQPEVFFTSD